LVGAVAGAVIGGLVTAIATGVVDALFAKRRDDETARIGAKVVAGQIGLADSQLREAEREGLWWRFYGVPISSWPDYQGVLVARLSGKDLETVAQAIAVMELLWQSMRFVPEFLEDSKLGSVALDRQKTRAIRLEAAKAYNALARLGGLSQEGEVISHPDPPSTGDR